MTIENAAARARIETLLEKATSIGALERLAGIGNSPAARAAFWRPYASLPGADGLALGVAALTEAVRQAAAQEVRHPLAVGTRVLILVENFDDGENSETRHAPAGEVGTIRTVDHYGDSQGWTYGIRQEPSGVYGLWEEGDFIKGEIILAPQAVRPS